MSKPNLIITYLVAAGDGISGGTRIHIESTKQWIKQKCFASIAVLASDDGYRTCVKNGIPRKNLVLMSTAFTKKIHFWIDYCWRTLRAIALGFTYKLDPEKKYYIYSASDFWADFFPALTLKLRYPKNTTLITPIYLFAPPFFKGYDGRMKFDIKLIVYRCMQEVMMFFARRYSQAIFVTYKPDLIRLKKLGFSKQKRFVIVGGIEHAKTALYAKKREILYDAVFVGRYHQQKGIFQLLEVWKRVVKEMGDSKLALLGNGDVRFENLIKNFIAVNNLEKNIFLLGFMDGMSKYRLFSKTRIYLNTNLYDAGGMATMEAMSCGLPVVSFDFPNSRSMIGGGVLWARYLSVSDFAKQVLKYLRNPGLVRSEGNNAREHMKKFDWKITSQRLLSYFRQVSS